MATTTITYVKNGPLNWNKNTNTFSGYLSDLQINATRDVFIKNPITGISKGFYLSHRDMDGSNEDCYGYNYTSADGLKLLLIND